MFRSILCIAWCAMADPNPQSSLQQQPVTSEEIAKVVRDELDRTNKYLEFAQNQIEKDRAFYKHLYGFAVGFLAFMVAVAGFFQYTSVSQMRSDMRASLAAEL